MRYRGKSDTFKIIEILFFLQLWVLYTCLMLSSVRAEPQHHNRVGLRRRSKLLYNWELGGGRLETLLRDGGWPSKDGATFVLPLVDLTSLDNQEAAHRRDKKSVLARDQRKAPPSLLRERLKSLMCNISKTLSDVDWYFALDQLEQQSEMFPEAHDTSKRRVQIRKMDNVDAKCSDIFLDSFIRQLYDMNPNLLDKMRSRIDEELTGAKRSARLVTTSQEELHEDISSDKVSATPFNDKNVLRRAIVKQVTVDEAREATYPEDAEDIEAANGEESSSSWEDHGGVPEDNQQQLFTAQDGSLFLDAIKELLSRSSTPHPSTSFGPLFWTSPPTTTPSSSTVEAFYDYADYYKDEGRVDVEGEEEWQPLQELAQYEVNQDIPDLTTRGLERAEMSTHRRRIHHKKRNKAKHWSRKKKKAALRDKPNYDD